MTPEHGALVIHLRGELAAMLMGCADDRQQKAPEVMSLGAIQIRLVAGTGFAQQSSRS